MAAVYLGFVALLVGAGILLANPVTNQVQAFQRDVPNLVDSANASLDDLQHWLDDRGIDVEIKAQGESALTVEPSPSPTKLAAPDGWPQAQVLLARGRGGARCERSAPRR